MSRVSDRLVGGYRVGRRIGTGGDAVVHEAWDDRTATAVALKLPANGDGAMLRREIAVLAHLRHPSIVAVRGADVAHPFLALDLLAGGSVQRLLHAAPLPVDDVAAVLSGAAAALAWLHGQHIVHADIKPANLMLRDPGRIGPAVLIDFATAHTQGLPSPGRVASAAYAAPELLLGALPDPRDDIYGLGVIAYQLLTGRHPFGPDPVLALDPPVRPGPLSDASWAWLRAALSPARAARPTTVADLPAALHGHREGAMVACPG